MGKHLVFVGGGHAHLTSLKDIQILKKRGHRVTLISPSAYHYYSGMGPGMLSGIYRPQEARFHIKKLAVGQGAIFVKDKVVKIDPDGHKLYLSSGEKIAYDVVSFNTGSEVPIDSLTAIPQDNLITVKPVVNLLRARQVILDAIRRNKSLSLVVVGGGPAGVDFHSILAFNGKRVICHSGLE